jgi:hypothetical protein
VVIGEAAAPHQRLLLARKYARNAVNDGYALGKRQLNFSITGPSCFSSSPICVEASSIAIVPDVRQEIERFHIFFPRVKMHLHFPAFVAICHLNL